MQKMQKNAKNAKKCEKMRKMRKNAQKCGDSRPWSVFIYLPTYDKLNFNDLIKNNNGFNGNNMLMVNYYIFCFHMFSFNKVLT
jgi:hypothetical protein